MALVECTFLIPILRDSEPRRPHAPLAWKTFEDALRRTSPSGHQGPETVFRVAELVPGEYLDDGPRRRTADENRRYIVALPKERVRDLRAFLRKAANTFDQRTIYLSIRGKVEFVKRAANGASLLDEDAP